MPPSLTVETRIFNTADTSAPLCTLQKEIDVSQFETFSQAEREAVAIGREFDAALVHEIVKKKKRPWWVSLWRAITRS
jgi:hypothetical protein